MIHFIVGIVVGIGGVTIVNAVSKKYRFPKFFMNLDIWVMLISMCLLILSITLPIFKKESAISTIYLNVFSTMVFSWLLTRFSAKGEFKERESELAKISLRHIEHTLTSIEMLNASINEFIKCDSDDIKTASYYELRKVAEILMHIENSIVANKDDHSDRLTDSQRKEKDVSKINKSDKCRPENEKIRETFAKDIDRDGA